MGKSTPSLPPAPDPTKVSAAQTQSNKETALYNFGLNNPNVITPLGSSTYTVANSTPQYDMDAYNKALSAWQNTGPASSLAPGLNRTQFMSKAFGATPSATGYTQDQQNAWLSYRNGDTSSAGAMPKISDFLTNPGGNPQSTQTITLSPEQRQLYDLATSQSIDLGKLASALQGRVGDSLSQPMASYADLQDASKKASDAYYNQQTAYLDPQYQLAQSQLDNKLANQGLMPGSEAWRNAEDQFNRNKTFAYNQAQQNAILQGPQNAQALFGLQTATRDQPLTEFNALRTGAQPQMPQFSPTTPSMAPPTNVAGNIWNAFGAQQDAYNQQVASQNAGMGGLFGLGGNLGAAAIMRYGLPAIAASDARLKENIAFAGQQNGHNIYHFSYKADPNRAVYRGVLAHEVFETRPDAVVIDGDYLAVDYGKIGIEFGRVH